MKIQSNYSIPKSNPSFGMGIQVTQDLAKRVPGFVDLVNRNSQEINKLTPNNEVMAFLNLSDEHVYLMKLKKGLIGIIDSLHSTNRLTRAEQLGNLSLIPKSIEPLKLPFGSEELMNALNKIMK